MNVSITTEKISRKFDSINKVDMENLDVTNNKELE